MTWCGRPIRKASKSRPSPTPPLRRVGASSASLSDLRRVLCLAVRRIRLRPVRSQLLVCLCPVCSKLRNRLPYRNNCCIFELRPGSRLPAPSRACKDFPVFRPSRVFRTCQHAAPLCLRRRLSSILRLGSDSVRGILAAMALAAATPTASSVTGNVTIPPARLSVRGRMTLEEGPVTAITPVTTVTPWGGKKMRPQSASVCMRVYLLLFYYYTSRSATYCR